MAANPYEAIFQDAAKEWNLDPAYLKAVSAQESSGNPGAVSGKGARGLMGMMPATGQGLEHLCGRQIPIPSTRRGKNPGRCAPFLSRRAEMA
jgi:hypothetical protein